MILCITNKCRMGCTHCFGDYKPDGNHMSMSVLEDSIKFINRIGAFMISVTGGEPSDHPQFLEIMNRLVSEYGKKRLSILSNGMFFEDRDYANKILDLRIITQITNDERYYPKRIKGLQRSWIGYENQIRTLYPQGRARDSEPVGRKVSSCFNIRSIGNHPGIRSFQQIVKTMEQNLKFCAPFIGMDGKIYLGESQLCTPIGTVTDSDDVLISNLKSLKCRNCGMPERMPSELLSIIEKM